MVHVQEWELNNAASILARAWIHRDFGEDKRTEFRWMLSYSLFVSNHRIPESKLDTIHERAARIMLELIGAE